MQGRKKRIFGIEGHCFLVYVLAMLLIPLRWVLSWVLAAFIHEAGHILLLKLLNVRIYSVTVGSSGARIITEPMSCQKELLCALAGPAAGLLPLLAARWLPYVALTALVQSCFNLIPVYPLDGGRAFQNLLLIVFSEKCAKLISDLISTGVITTFFVVGIWLSYIYPLGILPILFPAVPLLVARRKNFLQSREKNSTIRRRLTLRGNRHDFCTAKNASPSAKAGQIHRR